MRSPRPSPASGWPSVVPFAHLVIHLGVPSADPAANSRAAVARSLEEIAEAAQAVGVTSPSSSFPTRCRSRRGWCSGWRTISKLGGPGICLDVGHAHLVGDVMEAIETCSGHIVTTHVHDNGGKRDDHLVPGDGHDRLGGRA